MWKVLLVEDEVFVRESVRGCISWEDLGFTVIGEAGNGLEALEIIRVHRPDVVLCDIVMPEMDGVKLLQTVRAEGYDGKFIMLSCMSDFEFVRQALEFGASNYILKLSMNVQALKDALTKVAHELERKPVPSQVKPAMDMELWYRDLWTRATDTGESPQDRFTDGGARHKLPGDHVSLAIVLNGGRTIEPEEIWQREAAEQLNLHTWSQGAITLFLAWSPNVLPLCHPNQATAVPAIVTETPVPVNRLTSVCQQVLLDVTRLWYSGEAGTHRFAPEDKSPQTIPSNNGTHDIWKRVTPLAEAFESADKETFIKQLHLIWRQMEVARVPVWEVFEIAASIGTSLSGISGISKRWPVLLHSATEHHALLSILEYWALELLKSANVTYVKTDHSEVNKAIDYMHRHYMEELSVKQLAEYVSMHENYFSVLFKRKTGDNLIAYLHKLRVEEAKRLLRSSQLSIQDIGHRVGFESDNYFIKIFKRITGKTPNVYRQETL